MNPGPLWSTEQVVRLLAARVAAAPVPALGPRLVVVDGRSGSGKTFLSAALAERTGAALVPLEELYPGWDGLTAGVAVLEREVLLPLRAGRGAAPARWDWGAGRWGPRAPVPAAAVVLVEGVGAGCTAVPADLLVQLRAGAPVRRRRALGRDGATYAPHWQRWAAQEEALAARCDVGARADVVLDSDPPGGDDAVRWRLVRG